MHMIYIYIYIQREQNINFRDNKEKCGNRHVSMEVNTDLQK